MLFKKVATHEVKHGMLANDDVMLQHMHAETGLQRALSTRFGTWQEVVQCVSTGPAVQDGGSSNYDYQAAVNAILMIVCEEEYVVRDYVGYLLLYLGSQGETGGSALRTLEGACGHRAFTCREEPHDPRRGAKAGPMTMHCFDVAAPGVATGKIRAGIRRAASRNFHSGRCIKARLQSNMVTWSLLGGIKKGGGDTTMHGRSCNHAHPLRERPLCLCSVRGLQREYVAAFNYHRQRP